MEPLIREVLLRPDPEVDDYVVLNGDAEATTIAGASRQAVYTTLPIFKSYKTMDFQLIIGLANVYLGGEADLSPFPGLHFCNLD